MTDPRTPDVTDEDRRIARDWAESVHSYPDTWTDRLRAAARVILNDVPAPPLPTLADMTPEERAECQGMQADVGVERRIIVRVMDVEEGAVTLVESGDTVVCPHSSVTPRPDLPRFVWPGDTPAPAPDLPDGWRLADHPRYGRVLVTTPEPDCDGDLWFIDPSAAPGVMEDWCDPDVLTFLYDQGADQ